MLGDSILNGYEDRNTMGMGFDNPLVGVQKPMEMGLHIPWLKGLDIPRIGGHYFMSRGFDMP